MNRLTITTADQYATAQMETWGLSEMPHLMSGMLLKVDGQMVAYLDYEQDYSWEVVVDENGKLYGDC